MFRRHPVLTALTVVYLGVVAWVTLGPQPLDAQQSAVLNRIIAELARHPSLDWLTYSRVEFLANVAMFVPVGVFFLLLVGRRAWIMAVLAGIAATFTIEFTQLFLPTRVPDPRDVIANSAGAAIGVVAALIVTTPAALRARRARNARESTRIVVTGRS
ncbi:VanZ family protein [Galbitalea sp. SE-J8]|uniref:VanZ family protein n=1 Tax=Galbitalea sp. SE-J8 TaxID=3054952 RepID=UPI00259CDB6D|nr:VanZ family protein [Galbitalea sp. SE-J8]MDM4762584.1 VanZ family protein [Galbitalea sp. SE-J8]